MVELKSKALYFFKNILIYLVLLVVSVIIIYITDYFITEKLGFDSVIVQFQNNKKRIIKLNFITVAIIVPLLEEIIFRLFLIPSKLKILLSSIAFSFFLFYGTFINIDILSVHFILSSLCSIIISLFISYNYSKIEKLINNKIVSISYISIIFFGLFHLTNMQEFHYELILLYPIYVLPQISLGYVLTDLRMKLGFIWSFMFHFLINSVTFL